MKIPETITICHNGQPIMIGPEGDKQPAAMTFQQFVANLFNIDDRALQPTVAMMRTINRIEAALANAKAGDEVTFLPGDADLLAAIAENPSAGYGDFCFEDSGGAKLHFARQLLPFIEACCALTPKSDAAPVA